VGGNNSTSARVLLQCGCANMRVNVCVFRIACQMCDCTSMYRVLCCGCQLSVSVVASMASLSLASFMSVSVSVSVSACDEVGASNPKRGWRASQRRVKTAQYHTKRAVYHPKEPYE